MPHSNGKHVCTIVAEPTKVDCLPNASASRQMLFKIRQLMLPCQWHHGSQLFIRSPKSLQLERIRQLDLGHWYVVHPYSAIKFYWDCFEMLMTFTLLIYLPIQVFYNCPNVYDHFILLNDFITFLGICSCFLTGYVDEGNKQVVLEPKLIAHRYMRGYFIPDLIGALPLQLIQPFKRCEYPTHTAMFVFKLFRLLTFKEQWSNLLIQLEVSYIKKVAISVTLKIILFVHWMTYFHYQIPALILHFYESLEDEMLMWLKRLSIMDAKNSTIFQKYTANLFMVSGLCIGAGYYTPAEHHFSLELTQSAILCLIGLAFLAYSFTTLLRIVIYKQSETHLFNGKYKQLQQYMQSKKLPKSLQQKICLFVNYKYNGRYFNEKHIMKTINEQIRQDINMYCCKRLVTNVPVFQDLPIALINTIIFSLKLTWYMPGETVVKCGQVGNSLYLISSGTVAVLNASGREVAHLRDGSYFGERALIHPGSMRNATIIALEITMLYKLTSESFQACLQPYPHLKRRLELTHKISTQGQERD